MEPVFISVGMMVGALLLVAYYVQNGIGGMSMPMQTLGRFLLIKAPAGAVICLTTALAVAAGPGLALASLGWCSPGPSASWLDGMTGTRLPLIHSPASVGRTTTATGLRRP